MEIRLATRADFEQVGIVFAEDNRFHAELVTEIIQAADPIMTHEWYEDVTIELFPDADHSIQVNGNFAPGYYETINGWLKMRRG